MLNSEERCCKYPTKMYFSVIWGIIFNISLFYMDHSLRSICTAGPLHCGDLRATEESVNPKWSWFSSCDNLFHQPLPCPHRRRFQDKYFSGQWPDHWLLTHLTLSYWSWTKPQVLGGPGTTTICKATWPQLETVFNWERNQNYAQDQMFKFCYTHCSQGHCPLSFT